MNDFSSDVSEMRKELKVCYRREFLLSLAELDPCKKLPSQFDSSISRDTCAALLQPCDSEWSCLDRKPRQFMSQNPENGLLGKVIFPREAGCIFGASASEAQPMRQNSENRLLGKGSFPGEAGCIVGGSASDVQLMRQNPENGLLGKGSFPRKPGFTVGGSVSKFQSCGFHFLSRSATPYRPPHLSKVEIKGINDGKAFSSSDFPSMEEADRERKKRGSFGSTMGEIAFHEEQDQKEDLDHVITSLSGDFANDEKRTEKCSQSEKNVASSIPALAAVISMPGNTENLEDTYVHDLDEISDDDEICLPDEDSLITVEDFIVPKDSMLMPDRAWSSTEIESFSPKQPVEIFQKLAVADPFSDHGKSKTSMENVSWLFRGRENPHANPNAGQSNPHFYQPHTNPAMDLFHSQSHTAAGRSEVESFNSKLSYHLAPDLAFSTTLQSSPWQNFYDPLTHPSQRQIEPPAGGFPITRRTGSSQTKNSLSSSSQPSFWRL